MAAKINTTGKVRIFLADTLESIKNGSIEVEKAHAIVKMANQIHQSLHAEAKIMKIRADAGQTIGRLGHMEVGESTDD